VNVIALALDVYLPSPAKLAVTEYVPFFWLSLIDVVAMPDEFVAAVALCAPSVNCTVLPTTGWPSSSTTEALTVTCLFCFALRSPTYPVEVPRFSTVT
jgi:hypothetical protein